MECFDGFNKELGVICLGHEILINLFQQIIKDKK